MILLAGQVGRNPFADGVRRSVLDLPAAGDRTILDVWAARFASLAESQGLPRIDVRIALDREGETPRIPSTVVGGRVAYDVVRDSAEYRGTAGVVRDLTADVGDAELVLVAAASQLQVEPLECFLALLETGSEGVCLARHGSSEFASAFLLRRERLRAVSDVGFVDLKEQAIPEHGGSLPVVRRPQGSSLPIRTLEEYIAALRTLHATQEPGELPAAAPFAESWMPRFRIVEGGATVAEDAVIQDAVVLAGARVEAGAVVARSVVCPGAVVRRGQVLVESLIAA